MPDETRNRKGASDMETSQKLDQIQNTVPEVRVSMAALSGDVRAALGRLDGHDDGRDDVERRIRTLERDSDAIPGVWPPSSVPVPVPMPAPVPSPCLSGSPPLTAEPVPIARQLRHRS